MKQFCSFPRESFSKSIQEISDYNWEGASLIIEHCDAYTKAHAPIKGFLQLEDELSAIQTVLKNGLVSCTSYQIYRPKVQLGISINWGRSVLEGRSTETPIEHINQVKKFEISNHTKVLRGLMFSGFTTNISLTSQGCCMDDKLYGNWTDSHAPFKPRKTDTTLNSKSSLLTYDCAKKCLESIDKSSIEYLGVKIAPKPAELSIDERIMYFEEAIDILMLINE